MEHVHVSYPRIDTARTIVRDERAIIDRERGAFESFRSRLGRLDRTAASTVVGDGPLVATQSVAGIDPEAVRDAYRETVLAMSHYDDEYGESLLQHVEGEFGAEVRVLFEGQQPIPTVGRTLLVGAVDESIDRRRRVLKSLDRELESLDRVSDRLGSVERRFHSATDSATAAGDDGLASLAEECEAIAADRQATIHNRPTPQIAGIGDRSLVAYLYGTHDHRFPALVEVADVAARLAAARTR